MCSILGIINLRDNFKSNEQVLKRINKILSHRGPDNEGFYFDKRVSFAFNRLSIMDLNKGNQPIENKNIVTIFNGEIYNFKEIRSELKKIGHKFDTNSDSEIIAPAFSEWGIKCIEKFNGMFAIAIYDKNHSKVYLVRDRVGIKPLYYSILDNQIIFSSEIKGIINSPNFEKKINYNSLSSYFLFRYPYGNNNVFFENIEKLAPGSILEIDLNIKDTKKHSYWSIPGISDLSNKKEDYYLTKLEDLLNKSVKKQLVSDAPLGIFLSGGLDSSIISSMATKQLSGKLKTYSVGFEEKNYDESNKAQEISKFLGTEHKEIIVGKRDFLNNLENIINIKDVPVSIPHEYPMYLLSKKMKEEIKVVLSGEGADEFFGGYSRVQNSPIDYLKAKFLLKYLDIKSIRKLFSIDKNFNFNEKKFIDYFFHIYNWFSFEETNNLFSKDLKNKINIDKVKEPWTQIIKKHNNSNYYNQVLLMFQNNHLQCLLDRLDTMTMANSIEARVPFLDHEIIEFINTVPHKFKIKWNSPLSKFKSLFSNNFSFSEKYDINKYLLRKIGTKYLPNKISKAKKLGFPLPMNEWMRDKKVKELLLDKKTYERGFYNKDYLEKLISNAPSQNDPYDFNGKKIWMILNVELWMRNTLD